MSWAGGCLRAAQSSEDARAVILLRRFTSGTEVERIIDCYVQALPESWQCNVPHGTLVDARREEVEHVLDSISITWRVHVQVEERTGSLTISRPPFP